MIAAPPRGMSATLVSLVCLAGATVAGLVVLMTSDRPEVAAAAAVISGSTGVLAALAMMFFPRSPRPVSAESASSGPTSPAMRPQPDVQHPVERRSPSGGPVSQPSPPPTPVPAMAQPRPTPGPRHAAAPPVTDGEPQPTAVPPPGGPTVPPPDPRAAALLAEHRALLAEQRALLPQYKDVLAQRATLLRGLAELVARLPDEFAWQVAKLLEEAGARKVVPEPGAAFNPVLHSVFGTEPTPDAGAQDTVAYTLRAGWLDRDQVLVSSNVVLYALREQVESEPDNDQQ